jgi:endonuclease YncB( thermonuclease family)
MYEYKGIVKRVVDGDTVDAEIDVGFGIKISQRFRIDNYDAPETWRPRNEAEFEHGKKATKRAVELLWGRKLIFRTTKHVGIYGRYGATIILEDGQNFSEVMINEGYQKKEEYVD